MIGITLLWKRALFAPRPRSSGGGIPPTRWSGYSLRCHIVGHGRGPCAQRSEKLGVSRCGGAVGRYGSDIRLGGHGSEGHVLLVQLAYKIAPRALHVASPEWLCIRC